MPGTLIHARKHDINADADHIKNELELADYLSIEPDKKIYLDGKVAKSIFMTYDSTDDEVQFDLGGVTGHAFSFRNDTHGWDFKLEIPDEPWAVWFHMAEEPFWDNDRETIEYKMQGTTVMATQVAVAPYGKSTFFTRPLHMNNNIPIYLGSATPAANTFHLVNNTTTGNIELDGPNQSDWEFRLEDTGNGWGMLLKCREGPQIDCYGAGDAFGFLYNGTLVWDTVGTDFRVIQDIKLVDGKAIKFNTPAYDKTLLWSDANTRFEFNDTIGIGGDLYFTGTSPTFIYGGPNFTDSLTIRASAPAPEPYLQMTGGSSVALYSAAGISMELGDAAGTYLFEITDNLPVTQFSVDSDGKVEAQGDLTLLGNGTVHGGTAAGNWLRLRGTEAATKPSIVLYGGGSYGIVGDSDTDVIWDLGDDAGAYSFKVRNLSETNHLEVRSDGIVNMPNNPNCRVYLNAAQLIGTGAWTAIGFPAENFDTAAMHDNVTNNSRITIPTGGDGKYMIAGSVRIAANATGTRGARVYLNGTTNLAVNRKNNLGAGTQTWVHISTLEDLSAGDYVELHAYQDSGGNLNVTTGRANTFFAVTKVA